MTTYIDLFKNRIKSEISEHNGDKDFVDSLLPKISDDIALAGKAIGLTAVDSPTFKSYFETAKNEYLSVYPIDPGLSHSLTKEGFESWLTDKREKSITWNYSERYFNYLSQTGRSSKVVEETRRSSLAIVRKVADPDSKNETYIKGLVVGAVQSGKTGNFNAVINRAIDTGYGLIIVLSGIMEDLRSQTQKRIELDVIGEGRSIETNTRNSKGVGKIKMFGKLGGSEVNQVKAITSIDSDFSKALLDADFSLNDVNVLVCKKNVSVLRNIIVWLHDYLDEDKARLNIPLLVLDDEADNASLNNLGSKGREYASRTNSQIRALLALFSKKTYLGYTATPFANVLQDRNETPNELYKEKYKVKGELLEKELARVDNIFPDDFIELLNPPSNYIGAKQIFSTIEPIVNNTSENEKIPLVAPPVDDFISEFPSRVYNDINGQIVGIENIKNKNEWDAKFGFGGYLEFDNYADYKRASWAPKKDENFPKQLPDSLKSALNCFIISLAIRELRIPLMQNSDLFQMHNTMLIHISRYTNWQNTTKRLVDEYIKDLESKINNDVPSSKVSIYSELKIEWYKHYAHIIEHINDYLPAGYVDPYMVSTVFDSVQNILPQAIKGIEVKAINSSTGDKLEYPRNSPKKIIAVGGNRLSRGFTLEGLTINYFIRTANYSDALLQMGRWFGYRPGYLDCCKIFTSQDTIDKFNSTTECIEELENEFIKMEEQNKTPSNFILRVKKHPGTLMITRPSILKNAKSVNWSYADQLEMTTKLKVDKESIESTWENFIKNLAPRFNKVSKRHEKNESPDLVSYDTNSAEIINILKNQPNNFNEERISSMTMFIELANERGFIENWTVALKVSGRSEDIDMPFSKFNFSKNLGLSKISIAQRSGPGQRDREAFLTQNIYKASGRSANILSSPEDTAILLSPEQKKNAIESFYQAKANELMKKVKDLDRKSALEKAKGIKTVPERYYREQMKDGSGLLIIYLFDPKYVFNQNEKVKKGDPDVFLEFENYIKDNQIDISIPLVGYAIEFPPLSSEIGGEYMQADIDLDEDEDVEDYTDDSEGVLDDNE